MIDLCFPGVWIVDTTTGDYELTVAADSMFMRTLPGGALLALEHAGGAVALHSGDKLIRVGDRMILSLRVEGSVDWTIAHLTGSVTNVARVG